MSSFTGPNPIAAPVVPSGLTVGLELVATLPPSGATPPVRIQQLIPDPTQAGKFYVVDTRGLATVLEGDTTRPQPLLDLRALGIGFVEFSAENGFRSLAFHPDFATAGTAGYGKIYTVHSATVSSAPDGVTVFPVTGAGAPPALFHDVVTEWSVDDPADPRGVDPGSRRELFRIEEAYTNHNLNQLAFDPNQRPGSPGYGLLYLGVGDGGSANDPFSHAQDLGKIQGKILRIDPLLQDDGRAYRVPDDNPFTTTSGALGEIWAYGFRNPQTLAFDTAAGRRLFVGDIGQATIEEINIVLRGRNYGWNEREGTFVRVRGPDYLPLPDDDATFRYMYPFVQYDHEEIEGNNPLGFTNVGVAGGFVYRGTEIPELYGQYLFTDFTSGRVFHAPVGTALRDALADGLITPGEQAQPFDLTLVHDGAIVTAAALMGSPTGRVDLRFGQDAGGEIYVFSKQSGTIWKLGLSGDRVMGTDAGERLIGTAFSDVIAAHRGHDEVRAGDGRDIVYGGPGNDSLHGAGGDDRLFGGAHADRLFGGAGDDFIRGDSGDDHIEGGAGNDVLRGDAGDDVLIGGSGDDELLGGSGDDTLIAGSGRNRLSGGDGADGFVLTDSTGFTRILDLEPGETIDLRAILAGIGGDPITGRYLRVGATGDGGSVLRFDPDGRGPAESDLFARVDGVAPDVLLADHLIVA